MSDGDGRFGPSGGPGALQARDRAARQAWEDEQLSPLATRSAASAGRRRPEDPDRWRTCFERDRDRVLHSKAFRRLKHKTQVFVDPEGDHYVTRLTHALQVTQVARSLAAALRLNEPLAEAIALAHDVGHSPFGHTGEEVLDELLPGGWHHAAQGVRIYDRLEPLNLTEEVRDGIRAHTWRIDPPPSTPEGGCVRLADRIAYLTHDVLDALRAGALTADRLPGPVHEVLGEPSSRWIGVMLDDAVAHALEHGGLGLSEPMAEVMDRLRTFMFANVYGAGQVARRCEAAAQVVRRLVEVLGERPEHVPPTYRDPEADVLVQVADFVAGMTDRYALRLHRELVGPVDLAG